MPDSLARAIVDESVALSQSRPDLSALQVLDLAMRGRRGTSPDFGSAGAAAGDYLLDPSSAFGCLLAAAFDQQITFSSVRTLGDTGPNAFEEFWVERVRKAFTARYNLHPPA